LSERKLRGSDGSRARLARQQIRDVCHQAALGVEFPLWAMTGRYVRRCGRRRATGSLQIAHGRQASRDTGAFSSNLGPFGQALHIPPASIRPEVLPVVRTWCWRLTSESDFGSCGRRKVSTNRCRVRHLKLGDIAPTGTYVLQESQCASLRTIKQISLESEEDAVCSCASLPFCESEWLSK
jgi:hypothetical protein